MTDNEGEEAYASCESCGSPMILERTTPKVGPFPELWTYRCGHCGDVHTVERDEE